MRKKRKSEQTQIFSDLCGRVTTLSFLFLLINSLHKYTVD